MPSNVHSILGDINARMASRVVGRSKDLMRIPALVKDELESEEEGRFFRYVDELRAAAIEGMGDTVRLDDDVGQIDYLTALWLGLYFLGVPFNDPWEKAQCMAEAIGGFPGGACINKAVGDIYRDARQVRLREPERCKTAPPVVVLTRRPFLFMPSEWLPESKTRSEYTELGRTYVLLQLRLYLYAGLPIIYHVPAFALSSIDETGRITMAERIVHLVGEARSNQTIAILAAPAFTGGIPTCVIGWKNGVYTLEAGNEDVVDIAIAGNRITERLADSYRSKLVGRSEQLVHRLTWSSNDSTQVRETIERVLDQQTTTAWGGLPLRS